MRLTLAILSAIALSCAPTRPRPVSSPPIRISVDRDSGLDVAHEAMIEAALPGMLVTGRRYVMVPGDSAADVLVQRLTSRPCSDRVAEWDRDDAVFRIAPNCISVREQWARLTLHELGHRLGLSHICHHPRELPDRTHRDERCVGRYGRAIMNAYTSYPDEPVITEFTQLDLDALRRVGAIR